MGLNNKQANAIRDHAYAKGEFQKLTGKLASLKGEKARLEARLAELVVELPEAEQLRSEALLRLHQADEVMREVVPTIKKHRVRAIIATPKIHGLEWGDFNRELIRILKTATEEPISTLEIMTLCAEKFDIAWDTPLLRESLRDRIGKRLREWVKQGIIRRLPTAKPKDMAYWVWVGLE